MFVKYITIIAYKTLFKPIKYPAKATIIKLIIELTLLIDILKYL